MPISSAEFDQYEPPTHPETNAERVIRFLVQNRDQAYKASEIVAETDINPNSIHPVLTRLEDRSLVRHKEPYWTIGDYSAVKDAFVFHSTAQFLDDELGPESREEWLSAVDNADEDDA
ncbi:MarR family transcriptional regulator [Halocatena marina]|uniref:TrmB family transcriptional regulator n=1 Tax=Halocatena marina TaxID=2934937 RepID=A0ABD5YTK5_9EURY|nr:MarR family transcriptional regulator [Halocatena marina]